MTEKITSSQHKQIIRLIEDGIDAIGLSKDGAQRIIENGGRFQHALNLFVNSFAAGKYHEENEVVSCFGYRSGYTPKGIAQQTERLRELFPGIGYANEELANASLPENAEGWFAIPRWEKIAPTYGEAVRKVLDLIKQTRDGAFHNWREGRFGPHELLQFFEAEQQFKYFGAEQEGYDILVVPAQFGMRHRGCSVRHARRRMSQGNEVGLGIFAVGIMLLTHPERLQDDNDLWINCAGDEFRPPVPEDFSKSPVFRFFRNKIELTDISIVSVGGLSSTPSGCYPKD